MLPKMLSKRCRNGIVTPSRLRFRSFHCVLNTVSTAYQCRFRRHYSLGHVAWAIFFFNGVLVWSFEVFLDGSPAALGVDWRGAWAGGRGDRGIHCFRTVFTLERGRCTGILRRFCLRCSWKPVRMPPWSLGAALWEFLANSHSGRRSFGHLQQGRERPHWCEV